MLTTEIRHRLKPRLSDLISFALIVMVLIVFAQVRYHDFVNFDDAGYIYANPHIKDGLTWEGLKWAFTADLLYNDENADRWQPIVFISRMIDIELFGLNPGEHHIVNVWLHIFNTILLFVLLRKMTGEIWKSAYVAAVFGVHPLQVEAVAWATARKDVLSACLGFLTLFAYLNYIDGKESRKKDAVAVLFALTLMTKAMLVTLPFLLLLLDIWPLKRWRSDRSRRENFKNLVTEKWLLFMLAFASVIIAWYGERNAFIHISPQYFFLELPMGYLHYLKKFLWPTHLAVLSMDAIPTYSVWTSAGVFVSLLAITLFFIRKTNVRPYLLVGWLWFLGGLFPTIPLNPHADRFMYTPIIGLGILSAWGIPSLLTLKEKNKVWIQRALAVSTLSVFSILAWKQTTHWYDSISLLEHAIQTQSGNFLAYINLGAAQIGIKEYFKAHPSITPPEWIQKQLDERHDKAVDDIHPNSKEAYNHLGIELAKQDKFKEAARQFSKALSIDKTYTEALFNLATAIDFQEKLNKAKVLYLKVLKQNPDHKRAHNNLGLLLIKQKFLDEAEKHLNAALAIDPNYGEAHYNTGFLIIARKKKAWGAYVSQMSGKSEEISKQPANKI